MRNLFLFIIISFVIAACGNNTSIEDATLSQPPYNKLTDSIDKAPKDAGLYYRRGSLLYSNGETRLAENDLRNAWQLDLKEEYALRLTSILNQKNADTAIAFLQRALKKIPNSIALNISLAKGYESKNQLDKALAIADDIIKRYPGELDALMLKSEILKQQNKNSEALAILEKAYSFAPGDVDLVHQLAFEYAEAKNSKVLSLADSLIKVDIEKRHAEPY
jgi:tetratricopeptide (TPR) repeat protein